MRSMVEGASAGMATVTCPLHRLRRSPSPASRVRNRPVCSHAYFGLRRVTGDDWMIEVLVRA
jgi:hypothetical protein